MSKRKRFVLTFDADNYGDVVRILRNEAGSLEFAYEEMDREYPDLTEKYGPFKNIPFPPSHCGDPNTVFDPTRPAGDRVVGTWIIADEVYLQSERAE